MYVDAFGQFSDSQVVAADAQSTNTVDLGIEKNRLGSGEPMAAVIVAETALVGTMDVEVRTDSTDGGALADVVTTRSFAAAAPAGSRLVIPLPQGDAFKRFAALDYNNGTGTVTAFLIPQSMVQDEEVYPHGYTVS
jgi:hypothetical protein